MEGRVEGADGHGGAVHLLEETGEVGPLHGQELLEGARVVGDELAVLLLDLGQLLAELGGLRALGLVEPRLELGGEIEAPLSAGGGEDHLHHVGQTVLGEEHVLGAAEADAAGPEGKGHLGVARDVGVGPDPEPADLVGPGQELLELLVERRLLGLELARHDLQDLGGARGQLLQDDVAGGAVDRDDVAFLQGPAGDLQGLALGVDVQGAAAHHRGLAHLPAHDRGVRGHAAGRGEDALGHAHAVDVVRDRLHAHQDARACPSATRSRLRRP